MNLCQCIDKLLIFVQRLGALFFKIDETPFTGHLTSESIHTGMKGYLSICHISDRILYRIIENHVYIHFIIDGRRDMQTLLWEKVLRG
jgi:toxin ParE1/3/4